MTDELPLPPWKMDWTAEALREFETMPDDGKRLVLSARAELFTARDPYYRGIDADVSLPHWITVRPPASTSPGGPHIANLAGGRGLRAFRTVRAEPAGSPADRPCGRAGRR
ncbi:hypothetical protein [Streptomyces sp. MS2.AVA.5]|uniref:Uncharacterized protein n=1 Tax=Streptomyces achmelvichensis TaxID=3134111 RepID=A0ACC6PM38_9ACTN